MINDAVSSLAARLSSLEGRDNVSAGTDLITKMTIVVTFLKSFFGERLRKLSGERCKLFKVRGGDIIDVLKSVQETSRGRRGLNGTMTRIQIKRRVKRR